MRRRCLFLLITASIAFFYDCGYDSASIKKECTPVNRLPAITPDYSGIVLPYNIAPLNFAIAEQGLGYCAEISANRGKPIFITSSKPSLRIPEKQWKKLLAENRGGPLRINLYVRENTGQWLSYTTIEDTIASSPIDEYITYRTLNFLYNYSGNLCVYQRKLSSFEEVPLINTKNYSWGCCNCHTPQGNNPERFIIQSRSSRYGSAAILGYDGKIYNLKSGLGYPAWHPNGRIIAFSIYKVQQCFHAVGKNFIDVYDNFSDLVIYDNDKKKLVIVPQLHQKLMLETWPNWSPDGRYLYFCSAPILWADFKKVPPDNFNKVKYSLCRIPYDEPNDSWGTVDTVISSQETGLSISQPRISPDGRFILFCMHEFGGYPHTQKSSDLYIFDNATRKIRKPAVSSDYSESWHGWSTNNRWILFSSKRNGGIFTRIYFSYIDSSGKGHRPFIMPQRDPAFYDSFIKCYNFPEFAAGPVKFSEREILNTVRTRKKIDVPLPGASPAAAAEPSAWEHLRFK